MTTEAIYQSVLRQIGVKIQTAETRSSNAAGKISTKVGFKALIPFLATGDADVAAEGQAGTGSEFTWEFVGYDLGEAQSIGELLQRAGFNKFIVLENFHYLADQTQLQLAYDLKTFHELGIRFIILGIWQEANLLLFYNADLQDRVTETPVEPWELADFDRLIAKGSKELNIEIATEISNSLKEKAYRNVGLLQEFLRVLCELSGVTETQQKHISIDSEESAECAIKQKLDDQRGQLFKILQTLAGKSRTRRDTNDPLILPYYLVQAILKLPIDQWKNGISKQQLQHFIQSVHYRQDETSPREGDITNLMNQLKNYQKDMSSPFLHYNSEERLLRIVDMRHFFVLANSDRDAMFDEITNPLQIEED